MDELFGAVKGKVARAMSYGHGQGLGGQPKGYSVFYVNKKELCRHRKGKRYVLFPDFVI